LCGLTPSSRSIAATTTRVIVFGGVSVEVPASWPVFDLARHPRQCVLVSRHAVYLGVQGAAARCPAHDVGVTETVQLAGWDGSTATAAGRLLPVSLHRRAVLISHAAATTHSIAVAVPSNQVLVTVTFGVDEPVSTKILDSVRVVSASVHGAVSVAGAGATPGVVTTTYAGLGFETCSAPTLSSMSAWLSSPYRAVGIYIGGANRACPDGNLSASWVQTVSRQGWSLLPLYVGLQSPCAGQGGLAPINSSQARGEGIAAADDAAYRAGTFGISGGSAIFFDMEAYNSNDPPCTSVVLSFLAGWTDELRIDGFQPGVYSSAASGIRDLARAYATGYHEPTDIWFANWNGSPTVFGDPFVPQSDWQDHQRVHQYLGGNNKTFGGVTLNIDNDAVDLTQQHTVSRLARSAVVARRPTHLDVFYRDASGEFVNAWWDASSGWHQQTLAFGMAGDPAVIARTGTHMDVFYRDTDGQLINAWWDITSGWHTQVLTSGMVGDPTAVATSSSAMNVFYRDGFSDVINESWTVSSGWRTQIIGSGMAGDAAAVSETSTHIDVFYRNIAFNLANVWWDATSGWHSQVIAAGIAGHPTVVSTDPTHIDVFYRSTDNHLMTTWFVAGTGWLSHPLVRGAAGNPAAVARTTSSFDVFYANVQGMLLDEQWNAGLGWQNVQLGSGIAGDPAAVSETANHIDVFYRDDNSNLVNEWWDAMTTWHYQTLAQAMA
jgi:hypothetical protein